MNETAAARSSPAVTRNCRNVLIHGGMAELAAVQVEVTQVQARVCDGTHRRSTIAADAAAKGGRICSPRVCVCFCVCVCVWDDDAD